MDKSHTLLQTPNYKLQINNNPHIKLELTEADQYVITGITKYYLLKQ